MFITKPQGTLWLHMWFLTSQEVGRFGIADDGDVTPEEETQLRLLCGLFQNGSVPGEGNVIL